MYLYFPRARSCAQGFFLNDDFVLGEYVKVFFWRFYNKKYWLPYIKNGVGGSKYNKTW